MFSVERRNDGKQFLFRRQQFLEWFEEHNKSLYDSYCDDSRWGGYSSFICYLWCDPEKGDLAYSDVSGTFADTMGVNVSDARCYYRTALRCIIEERKTFCVNEDEYSNDTSPVMHATKHNGRLKLCALMGIAVSHSEDILYVGSGEITVEKELANKHVDVKCVDVVGDVEHSTLRIVEIDRPVVINDAYYEGFEEDQKRLSCASVYYAKRCKVATKDYLFVLPGMSESRYTNNAIFKTFMCDMLKLAVTAHTRDDAVITWLRRKFGYIELFLRSCGDGMGSRVITDVCGVGQGTKVKFKEVALFERFSIVEVDGVSYTKPFLVTYFRNHPLSKEFVQATRDFLEKGGDLFSGSINRSLLRGSCYDLPFVAGSERDIAKSYLKKILPVSSTIPQHKWNASYRPWHFREGDSHGTLKSWRKEYSFVDDIRMLIGNQVLLDYECGDGLFSLQFKNSVQYDHEDVRLDKSHDFGLDLDYQWVLLRYVLHDQDDFNNILNMFSDKNIIVIEHDPRGYERELHEYYQLRCVENGFSLGEYYNLGGPNFIRPSALKDFNVIKVGGRYNSYLAYKMCLE